MYHHSVVDVSVSHRDDDEKRRTRDLLVDAHEARVDVLARGKTSLSATKDRLQAHPNLFPVVHDSVGDCRRIHRNCGGGQTVKNHIFTMPTYKTCRSYYGRCQLQLDKGKVWITHSIVPALRYAGLYCS